MTHNIVLTGDLREAIAEKTDTPVDDTEAFIVQHDVIDDEGEENVRFNITWTTKKMQARINEDLIQDDATYRLTWMGFPVFVSGRSTPTGKFFPSHVTLSSHEDDKAWATTHEYVKRVLGKAPKKQMADGAKDISKSGKQVFGNETKRLMCWPHVNRNVEKRLKVLKRESKSDTLDKQVKSDICHFQWATSEREYESNFNSLKDKYTKGP